jgi:hypothetical protein
MAKKKTALKRLIWQKPEMEGGRQNPSILRITVRENETQIDLGYSAYNIYINGGWIRIHADTYLHDKKTGDHYKLTKAEGIPIAPEKLEFQTKTDWQYFSLFFEPLPQKDLIIDFIEPDNSVASDNGNNFDFFGIKLKLADALEEY